MQMMNWELHQRDVSIYKILTKNDFEFSKVMFTYLFSCLHMWNLHILLWKINDF
jgi:hypothetical protein